MKAWRLRLTPGGSGSLAAKGSWVAVARAAAMMSSSDVVFKSITCYSMQLPVLCMSRCMSLQRSAVAYHKLATWQLGSTGSTLTPSRFGSSAGSGAAVGSGGSKPMYLCTGIQQDH
jgi:hypothetical protein